MLEGMLVGIERGYFQSEIADAAYREQDALREGPADPGRGQRVRRTEDERTIDILVIPPETEARQVDRLRRVRAERDERGAGGPRAASMPRRPRPTRT